MNCTIQSYSCQEKEKLSKIYYKILHDEFPWVNQNELSMENFEKSTEGEAIYVAFVGDEVVGFASVWEQDSFIHNLFVSKQYRRLGVGKKLLEKVISIYPKPMTLKCVKENHNAVSFYMNNGWKIERQEMGSEGAYYLMSFGS